MKAKNSIRRIAIIVLGSLLFVRVHAQHATTFKFSETAPEEVLRVMENNANALFSEINRKYDQNDSQLNLSSSAVTSFARKRIANMWAVSHFYCTRTSMITRVLKMVSSDKYQVRDIPICYKEAESQEYQNRFVVLEFDNHGKISDLYCSLPEYDITDAYGNVVTDLRHKEQINSFITMFFTAYNCKDTALIAKMYSDDALIITGKVVSYKNGRDTELSKTLIYDTTRIEFSVQNKKEYMKKLKGIFSRNNYINIKFDGVEIIQSEANPKIFGVRLNQYWHVAPTAKSKGYSDEGKLFLIIDYTNEYRPEIWVRTWQPFQDAKGKPIHYSPEDFFAIGDFRIDESESTNKKLRQ